jgi:N-methylhydantoinase B
MAQAAAIDAPATRWDGTHHSYVPSPDWRSRVSEDLRFFDSTGTDLDPVTFEILRNRLWTINMAHGETLTRISGSPVMQALDFNMSILTGEGEIVMNAPFVQFLDAPAPLGIRYILEHLSEGVGVADGDVFLCNDPWIAAAHQNDVLLACPVFVEGELFAWVSSAGHQIDLGGIVPGGWPQNSPDVWSDPPCFPPFKLVEGGRMREDLESLYLRQSRLPDLVALDLRAGLAGLHYAKTAMLEACAELGADVVHAAMGQILDNAQRSVSEALERLPDGTWTEVRYVDEALPGDRGTYRLQVNVTKRGDRMTIDNRGSAEQREGPLGVVYAVFEGTALGVMSVTWLADHLFSVGGAARQIDFEPTPGLITCCDHPAAVAGGICTSIVQMNALYNIFARMLSTDPSYRGNLVASGIDYPLALVTGVTDDGTYKVSQLVEAAGQGTSARMDADGVHSGGPAWSPLMRLLNMEAIESFFPLLYLYRRENKDSAGAGRWRGGAGSEIAAVPHGARHFEIVTNFGGQAISTANGLGLFGGYPSPTSFLEIRRHSDTRARFAAGAIPADVEELSDAGQERLRAKSNGTEVGPDDVIVFSFPGGVGVGDPIERDPGLVAADVQGGRWTIEAAKGLYAVVLTEDLRVDEAATERAREDERRERSEWRSAAELPAEGNAPEHPTAATSEPATPVQELLAARDDGDQRVLACAMCDTSLGDYKGNFKLSCLVDESPLTFIPGVRDPRLSLDHDMTLRRFACPGCSRLLTTEFVRDGAPITDEFRLA